MRDIVSNRRKGSTSQVGRSTLRRAFWVALLVLHTLALPSLVTTAASASVTEQLALVPRIAGLPLSAVFFALKFLDVSWLRARQDWRRVVAAVLIVALLHVGVIDRALTGQAGADLDHMPWVFVGAILGTGLLIRRLLAEMAVRFPSRAVDGPPAHFFAGAVHRAWRPHESVAHVLFAALRAPPAC